MVQATVQAPVEGMVQGMVPIRWVSAGIRPALPWETWPPLVLLVMVLLLAMVLLVMVLLVMVMVMVITKKGRSLRGATALDASTALANSASFLSAPT